MPVRVYRKGQRDRLEWRRPNRETLQNLLHHPAYAGAYRYGHRPTDPRRKVPGRPSTGRLIRPAEQCAVLIRDHVPAYIGWERFESNQRTLAENRARSESRGAPRPGPSLLGGLLVCGRCGRRMMVRYSGKDGVLRYDCARGSADYAEPLCQTTPGRLLDELIAGRILAAITPAALEASLAAVADVEQQRRQLAEQWRTRLERARYETERAARQFHAVEPENRLVGRELERRWEEALKNEQSLRCEHEKSMRDLPASLTEAERAEVLALASDLPALWQAETTTAQDRQRVARLLLERVVVEVLGKGDQVDVRLEWVGGFVSTHRVVKAVSRYDQKSDWPRVEVAAGRAAPRGPLGGGDRGEPEPRGIPASEEGRAIPGGDDPPTPERLRVDPASPHAGGGPHVAGPRRVVLERPGRPPGDPRGDDASLASGGLDPRPQARRAARAVDLVGRRGRVGAAEAIEVLPSDLG